VATLLQQSGGVRVEVAKPPLFSGKMEEVGVFVNVAYLYLSITNGHLLICELMI